VERAGRQRPGFEPRGAELATVREWCGLVEGMPLGIELAAARLRVMGWASWWSGCGSACGCWAVAARAGTGALGRRSRVVGALAGVGVRALAQCSVFEGGFPLEAAEGALDLGAWPDAPWVVDVVQSLVDKSLLRMWVPQAGSAGEVPARVRDVCQLQEYARARLGEMGRGGGARRRGAARAVVRALRYG